MWILGNCIIILFGQYVLTSSWNTQFSAVVSYVDDILLCSASADANLKFKQHLNKCNNYKNIFVHVVVTFPTTSSSPVSDCAHYRNSKTLIISFIILSVFVTCIHYIIPATITAAAATASTAIIVRRGVLSISRNYWLDDSFPNASPEFAIL